MSSKVYIPTLSITIESPYITQKKYADMMGLTEGVVEGWVQKGYVHSRKIGTRRMVNLAAETVAAAYREELLDKIILQAPDTGFRYKEI